MCVFLCVCVCVCVDERERMRVCVVVCMCVYFCVCLCLCEHIYELFNHSALTHCIENDLDYFLHVTDNRIKSLMLAIQMANSQSNMRRR